MFGLIKKIFGTAQSRAVNKFLKIVHKINEWDEKYKELSDEALRAKTQEFKERHKKGETLDDLLPEAFGAVKNVCRRLVGTEVHVSGYNQKWDMIPYDVQLIGAIALHRGNIAEMQTGEGKTLTAVMPLYLNALTEKPVHLVTVNDYLAKRDCEWVGTILRWLGLTTGALMNRTDSDEREELYKRDVLYGTASEFGFDYLRDNSMTFSAEDQVQRGYYYAIVDEVDSILIDEARTPLIISGPSGESKHMYDSLKGGVESLVKVQRDYCNRLATEAWKVLGSYDDEDNQKWKKYTEEEREALDKLWLISKGTPRNKILKRIKENPDFRKALDEIDLYYYSEVNKKEKAERLANLYMSVDEKSHEFELTDKGIEAWAKCRGTEEAINDFVLFDISEEFMKIDEDLDLSSEEKVKKRLEVQEEDAMRKERSHNLRQLLHAHLLMEKDVEYIVKNGKIIIIDENTGRPQPGRRFSDGLHQAIEAKEGVHIQRETQTYATVTLQNYFRMYDKLAGMTGTAMTEAVEFKQIYKMHVIAIPTNKPCVREDVNDEIYMTEREKYNAILKEVKKVHEEGRPILLGSESVDISEKLARIFKQNKISHTVLNARQHDKEAEIIANAGKRGAVTISTNMAGRGTDIKLGEGVAEIGGLYVLGTARHHSRRIDRQLRGRSGRQGDPGSSKFFVSFEDSLLRLFSSPRLTSILQRLRPPEGEAMSAGMLNKMIETAQKRLEQRNYVIRKNTLQYDDVMNKHRQEVYSFRNEVIHEKDIYPLVYEMLENVCHAHAEQYFSSKGEEGGWNPEGYRQWLLENFPVNFEEGVFDDDLIEVDDVVKLSFEKIKEAFLDKIKNERVKLEIKLEQEEEEYDDDDEEEDKYEKKYQKEEDKYKEVKPWEEDDEWDDDDDEDEEEDEEGDYETIEDAIRDVMLRKIDQRWLEHLSAMDHLRTEVYMRAAGQQDPLMEFKQESFRLFHDFTDVVQKEIAHDLFRFQIVLEQHHSTVEALMKRAHLETNRSFVSGMEGVNQGEEDDEEEEEYYEPFVSQPKTGRNDPCPCGSGKKFKKCCGIAKEKIS